MDDNGSLCSCQSELHQLGYTECTHANDAVRANQLDKRISDGTLGIALAVSLNVSEITNVTGLVRRSTVGLVMRVDYGRAC